MTTESEVLRLAGCVVWKISRSGRVKVLVAHSPKNDEWILPKGKRDKGETDMECACREVFEESGASGEMGQELSTIEYEDGSGRTKSIRFWAMHYVEGEFEPNSEIDEIAWVKLAKVEEKLSGDRYTVLIDDLRDSICVSQ